MDRQFIRFISQYPFNAHHYRYASRSRYQPLRFLYNSANNDVTTSRQVVCDLRSDTVTKPTPEMIRAMMESAVGDDVFEEDPTVNQLETHVARLTGKESSLFCASGTMSNQIAIRSHLKSPPYSIICDERSHVFQYEAGGISFHSGAHVIPITVTRPETFLTPDAIREKWIVENNVHYAPTKLICIENPLNGNVFPIGIARKIRELAQEHHIPIHCDGARLWNASIATNLDMKTLCEPFDTVSLCFSKGLGTPVGSILVGPKRIIDHARHLRKLFGGGWRQAGILAGACLHALKHHWPLMKEDHRRAKQVSEYLQHQLGLAINPDTETNMVWIHLKGTGKTADYVAQELEKYGILIFGGKSDQVRLVFHHQVTDAHVEHIISAFDSIFSTK